MCLSGCAMSFAVLRIYLLVIHMTDALFRSTCCVEGKYVVTVSFEDKSTCSSLFQLSIMNSDMYARVQLTEQICAPYMYSVFAEPRRGACSSLGSRVSNRAHRWKTCINLHVFWGCRRLMPAFALPIASVTHAAWQCMLISPCKRSYQATHVRTWLIKGKMSGFRMQQVTVISIISKAD